MELSRAADRLVSLDAFRGAVIACMILVNNPGNGEHVYAQLGHVPWHGWTFADLIAPCFLWVIGVTTVLSLSRRMERNASRLSLIGHVLRRAGILYLVGMGLEVFPRLFPPYDPSFLNSLQFMGILQRIAICYALGTLIFIASDTRGQIAWTVVLLLGHWVLLLFLGKGAGPFESGSNFAGDLDRWILGSHGNITHSLLSVMTVTATVLMGSLVGTMLKSKVSEHQKALWLVGAGIALICLGLLLDPWIPINRRLWTPSYCLFTAGIAMTVFSGFYWINEVRGVRGGFGLLIAYGLNPIFLFVLSEVGRMLGNVKGYPDGGGIWRSQWTMGWEVLVPMAGPQSASLIFGLAYTLLFGFVAMFMRRKGWIVKI